MTVSAGVDERPFLPRQILAPPFVGGGERDAAVVADQCRLDGDAVRRGDVVVDLD